jgi:prepilin-type processing-associated H-X9-DG protein
MKVPRKGMTFIELLVAVGIIILVMAIAMPSIQRVREAANRLGCESNVRQVAIALHQFHDDKRPQGGGGALSWMVHLLPYLEQDALYQQSLHAVRLDRNTNNNPPHVGASTVIKVYTCPTDRRVASPHVDPDGMLTAFSSFIGVAGDDAIKGGKGFFAYSPFNFSAITDGLSHTIMLAERPPPDTFLAGRWYSGTYNNAWTYMAQRGPDFVMYAYYRSPLLMGGTNPDACEGPFFFSRGRSDNPCDRHHFWSMHPGGANFAFADASIRFVRYEAEPIIQALATVKGGETLDLSMLD